MLASKGYNGAERGKSWMPEYIMMTHLVRLAQSVIVVLCELKADACSSAPLGGQGLGDLMRGDGRLGSEGLAHSFFKTQSKQCGVQWAPASYTFCTSPAPPIPPASSHTPRSPRILRLTSPLIFERSCFWRSRALRQAST